MCACAIPITASSHEQRDVGDGQYSMEVGFRDEPAYLSQPNALYLNVTQFGSEGGPVEGLTSTLQAEAQKDEATLPLTLVPQAESDVYVAPFIPSALGDYTFRLFGEIEGTSIDESFSSSPTTFAPVEPRDQSQFPVNVPAGAELVAQLDAANARSSHRLSCQRHWHPLPRFLRPRRRVNRVKSWSTARVGAKRSP